MWYVYILRSLHKNWYYVGSTNRIVTRIEEHNVGKVKSTKGHIPLELVYTEEFTTEGEARLREQRIKKQRLLKEGIIRSLGK